MKRFLLELFARHDWTVSHAGRYCTICARRDIEEVEQNEWGDSLEWRCIDDGDMRKHWPRVALAASSQ